MLVEDVQAALLNQRWEPGWKSLIPASRTLGVWPHELLERVGAIFGAAEPRASVRLCLELVLEVLALAPPRHAVRRAQTMILDALARNN
jgi:hypothetical protein